MSESLGHHFDVVLGSRSCAFSEKIAKMCNTSSTSSAFIYEGFLCSSMAESQVRDTFGIGFQQSYIDHVATIDILNPFIVNM